MEENNDPNRLITLAIHTYDKAVVLKSLLERSGVPAVLHNVNLSMPVGSSGVRVRIHERDLPLALKVIENESLEESKHVATDKNCVLIPVDFSEYSMKACKIGFEYAHKINSGVILLHTYMNENNRLFLPFASDKYTGDGFDEKASKQSAKRHMIGFKAEIVEKIESKELPHVNFRTSVVEGIPEECILQCASDNDVSLIVMGTRGVNKKEHDLLGSVTAEVLDACKFPVFTVPENISLENLESIQHIAFFSNLIQQDVISFDIFTRFFDNRQLEVTIISVLDNKDDARADDSMKQLIQYCEDHYTGYKFRDAAFSQSSFLDEFQQYVVDNHIDLIVVPNKKKNIFARLFNPSLAHRVLFQSDTPMLVVPV